jgi:hypothetical protein
MDVVPKPPSPATLQAIEGLDQVPWKSLSHAYGSAGDVPDLIRAVALGTGDLQEEAWGELHGNIWHQGTIYEATAPAIRFLMCLFLDRERTDRENLGRYIFLCSKGTSFLEVHSRYLPQITATVEQQMDREKGWVVAVHRAVSVFSAELGSIVDDEQEPEVVRACAYAILYGNPQTRPELLNRLMHDLVSASWMVRGWAALVLADQQLLPQYLQNLAGEALRSESDEVVRICLAYGMIRSGDPQLCQLAFHQLAAYLLKPDQTLAERFATLYFEPDDLEYLVQHGCLLGTEVMLTSLINELAVRLSATPDRRAAMPLAVKMLDLVFFGRDSRSPKITAEALNDHQRQVLICFQSTEQLWSSNIALGPLQSLGIPSSYVEFSAFMGQPGKKTYGIAPRPQSAGSPNNVNKVRLSWWQRITGRKR